MKNKNKKINLKKENINISMKNSFKFKLNISKLKKLSDNLLFSNLNKKKSVFAERFLTEITPEETDKKKKEKKIEKNLSFNKKIRINRSSFSKSNNKEIIPEIPLLKRYYSQINFNNIFLNKKSTIKKSITEGHFNVSNKKNKKNKKINLNKKYEYLFNNINHLHKKKFISYFLTPMNNFIKNDFKLFYDDYEKINNKIILNYSNINPIKKKFLFPKIPKIPFNLQNNFSKFKYKL